eukprot:1342276-Rhodomonas_salina.1
MERSVSDMARIFWGGLKVWVHPFKCVSLQSGSKYQYCLDLSTVRRSLRTSLKGHLESFGGRAKCFRGGAE